MAEVRHPIAGGDVPDARGLVRAGGDEKAPVVAEVRVIDPARVLEHGNAFAGPDIPKHRGAVEARGDGDFPVRAEGDVREIGAVFGEQVGLQSGVCGEVERPDFRGVIHAAGDDPSAVVVETGVGDFLVVNQRQAGGGFAGRDVPDARFARGRAAGAAGGEHGAAIAGEGGVSDHAFGFQDAERFGVCGVPEARQSILGAAAAACDEEAGEIGTEGGTGHRQVFRRRGLQYRAEGLAALRFADLGGGSIGEQRPGGVVAEEDRGVLIQLGQPRDEAPVRLRVPGADGALPAGRDDPPSIRADGHLPDGIAQLEDRRNGLAGLDAPEPRAVRRGGEHVVAAGIEGHPGDGLAVPERRQRRASGGHLPNAHSVITPGAHDQASIGAVSGVIDGALVFEFEERRASARIPDARRFIVAGAEDAAAIRAEADGNDAALVFRGEEVFGLLLAVRGEDLFAGENIPEFHGAAVAAEFPGAGGEAQIIRGKGRAIDRQVMAHVAPV